MGGSKAECLDKKMYKKGIERLGELRSLYCERRGVRTNDIEKNRHSFLRREMPIVEKMQKPRFPKTQVLPEANLQDCEGPPETFGVGQVVQEGNSHSLRPGLYFFLH
jgi:hypothetical protein